MSKRNSAALGSVGRIGRGEGDGEMALDAFSPYESIIKSRGDRDPLFDVHGTVLDYGLLELLIDDAARRGKSAQSGDVARALDMWVAEQFRRAELPEDAIWPRLVMPRALDASILSFIGKMPPSLAEQCCASLTERYRSSSVSVMGAAYSKQVDVGMATWPSGPELLVSTKTMGSSFGKNMANRFEEAYGDAKNLKSRNPFAATGFAFLVHADILNEHSSYLKALAMLEKLRAEQDVYDAVCLIVADWSSEGAVLMRDEPSIPASLSAERFFAELVRIVLMHAATDAYPEARAQFVQMKSHREQ